MSCPTPYGRCSPGFQPLQSFHLRPLGVLLTHPATTRLREEPRPGHPLHHAHPGSAAPEDHVPRVSGVKRTTQRSLRPSTPGETRTGTRGTGSISSAGSGLLPGRSAPPLGGEPYSLGLERRSVTCSYEQANSACGPTKPCDTAKAACLPPAGWPSKWLASGKRSPALLGFLASSPTS